MIKLIASVPPLLTPGASATSAATRVGIDQDHPAEPYPQDLFKMLREIRVRRS
jgi:hypothetical protein